ncbi:autotransporter outer membrane beta-barrel domain-containing protein [Mixta tenebrionis]|uniref:Autotransporter outer membrane beta-barrel domain-containing protein n=1 Tax=Mixta tenebrionis TaxID=2562439 RepID=A0A506VDD1_9GAMM|nr:autotransporter outer membrane beta-barrel domain-containing protein [Mixta tenebrionis]TPW43568.1 autotransporter outer membrane beta-barrel domain-containing protein [Mixta tenebrionis]
MSELKHHVRIKADGVKFKKRYLAGLVSTLLITGYPLSSPAAPLFVVDDEHDQNLEINGGTYDAAFSDWADAVIVANGPGKKINASDITINTSDAALDNKAVSVENGATVTLNNATINGGYLRSSGSTIKLNNSEINTTLGSNVLSVSDNSSLTLDNSSINFVNDQFGYALTTSNGVTLDINRLTTNGALYIADAKGSLDNSEINHSSIFNAMGVDNSTLAITNSNVVNNNTDSGTGLNLTNNSKVNFQHGTIKSAGKALGIIASEFTGNDLTITSAQHRAIEASQLSKLTLNNSTINGTIGIYANSSEVNLTDVNILLDASPTPISYGWGLWLQNVQNCTGLCGTGTITRTRIETKGNDAYGMSVSAGAQATADDLTVITHGNKSTGVNLSGSDTSKAASTLTLTNSNITTYGNEAHGVLVRNGHDKKVNHAELDSVTITTSGEYSGALGIWEGASLNASNLTVNNSGINSDIFYMRDGSAEMRNQLTVENGTLENTEGNGIYGHGFSDILLKDSTITVKGKLLNAVTGSDVKLDLDHVTAKGNITAAEVSNANIKLLNSSNLTGTVTGVNSFDHQGSVWTVTGDSDVKTLRNAGEINFADTAGSAGRTLTVKGDYVSDGGMLTLLTRLGDDDSLTDRLVVEGSTAGKTNLKIINDGGLGAETNNGIKVVMVGGESNGLFELNNRVGYGGYEYLLYKGGVTDNDGDWYLRSTYKPEAPDPEDPVPNPDPTPNPGPDPIPTPNPGPSPTPSPDQIHLVEPEVGAYIGNQAIANQMFYLRLRDRAGESLFNQPKAVGDFASTMWLRTEGGQTRSRAAEQQLKVRTNAAVTQLGGDIVQYNNGESLLRVGVLGGYGDAHLNSHSVYTGYKAKSRVKGYSAGLYATWHSSQDLEQNGMYVDGWLQHGWFDNDVTGDGYSTISYKSKGFSASLETGYSLRLADFPTASWFIQPQAQLSWSGIHADDVNDKRGSTINSGDQDYWQTRLGVRTWLRGTSPVNRQQIFQPFVELNWLHNTEAYEADYHFAAGSRRYTSSTAKDVGEFKVGLEGKLMDNLSVWGNVAHRFDDDNYSYTAGMLGVKYQF